MSTAAKTYYVVSFDTTQEDAATILKIAQRAVGMFQRREQAPTVQSVAMDVTACHANGCPLRLLDLLMADSFNFAHDVFGIARHIDRDTGKLGGHFSPRFSA